MQTERLKAYAHTLLTTGVHLKKGGTLVVSTDVEQKDFATIVTREAYALGAAEVVINWRAHEIAK